MLEFKPFDIDDKTHGYRAEENGENIGECIFSLDGTYAEILSVKTRDGDRLVAEGLVRSALNFAAMLIWRERMSAELKKNRL